ncbi:MAG: ComEC/Rec2 family competence protein [Alphaproteobacteria bacterium]|nr:ComEC/Rec2 family competence protein [Alphaproteobacteria bacterium]
MKPLFFLEEEEHKGIFLIMSFILGILIYFSLPFEPSFAVISLCLVFVLGLTFFFFFRSRFKFFSFILFFLVLGVFISSLHATIVNTDFLIKTIDKSDVIGSVIDVEERPQSARITLENVLIRSKDERVYVNKAKMWVSKKAIWNKSDTEDEMNCLDLEELNKISDKRGVEKPSKKISTDTCVLKKPDAVMIKKGDLIIGKTFLIRPPSNPTQYGGYYEARTLFFDGIGAVGNFSNVLILKESSAKYSFLEEFKRYLKEKISFLKPETRGVIQALLVGDADLITAPIEVLYRSLGLTHILSVSGFHVGLISFLVYYFFRLFLVVLTFKVPVSPFVIRALSSLVALIVSFCYVLLTGAEPPAVRAFIMTAFVFLCFFMKRQALSIRTVFVAAFLILCYKPVLVLSVGFQLSFMAVLTLCVLVKNVQTKVKEFFIKKSFRLFVVSLVLLNVFVTLVSWPFIAYHFHKIALYGILGNLLLSFIFSLFIMPLLLLGALFAAFQWSDIFFVWAEKVLLVVHYIGEKITVLPFMMVPVPAFSGWGLFLFSFGFIIFCCMKGRFKYVGLLLIGLFFFSFMTYPKSDIKLGREGRLLAVRMSDGKFLLNESYRHHIVSDNWLLANAENPENYSSSEIFNADYLIVKGKKIAFEPVSCQDADLTIEMQKKDYSACPHLISKEKLKQMGSLDVFIHGKELFLFDYSLIDRNRPWNQKRREINDF